MMSIFSKRERDKIRAKLQEFGTAEKREKREILSDYFFTALLDTCDILEAENERLRKALQVLDQGKK